MNERMSKLGKQRLSQCLMICLRILFRMKDFSVVLKDQEDRAFMFKKVFAKINNLNNFTHRMGA